MKKNEFGVWEITVPPTETGECAIPHDSKLKVRPTRLFAAILFLTAITDLHDPALRDARRAHSCVDHQSDAGSVRVPGLRRAVLEPACR